MPQRLLSLISNTQNNTHRNISWHIDPKDRPGTALPSRISWKLQPACPEGLGGDRESPVPHTLGRTRVKALELAGSAWLSHGRSHTELTQQDRHQTAPNPHRAQWECGKEGNKPLTKGFAPGSAGQGTVWLFRLPSVTQQPQLSPLLPQQHQSWPCSCRGSHTSHREQGWHPWQPHWGHRRKSSSSCPPSSPRH